MAEDPPYNPIRGPDWDSPFYASQRPEPTWERLNSPSSRVWVKNTSEAQNHIVIDKFNVGHELRPGERREMEMLNEEIAYFQEHRLPDRYYPPKNQTDPPKLKPPHAILIEGVPSMIEEQRAIRDAKAKEAFLLKQEQIREQQKKGKSA
jgi:hypothetical protein